MGGTGGAVDNFTGNTLNVNGFHGAVNSISNFEKYSFHIPNSMVAGGTMLAIGGAATDLTNSMVTGISIAPLSTVGHGDTVILISKVAGSFTTTTLEASKGAALIYDATVSIEAGSLIAKMASNRSVRVNPQGKALAQSRIGGMTLLNMGAEPLPVFSGNRNIHLRRKRRKTSPIASGNTANPTSASWTTVATCAIKKTSRLRASLCKTNQVIAVNGYK